MNRKTLLIIVLVVFCGNISAQKYASQNLLYIGEMLPAKSIPQKDSVFYCAKALMGKNLVVNYNKNSEISHLGVSLFSAESKALINNNICNFIERIMLDLLLNEQKGALQQKLYEYKITLTTATLQSKQSVTNLSALLNTMKEPVNFILQHAEKEYTAIWKFENGTSLEMNFPANRELIFGTNKKEAEFALNNELVKENCTSDSIVRHNLPEDQIYMLNGTAEDLFVTPSNYFIITQLNNQQVFRQNADKSFVLLFDKNFPEISLKNILLTPEQSNLKLHIKHRMYGNFTPEFEMKLTDFICFFKEQTNLYCFVEKEDSTLNAYLIIHSQEYNYIHLLLITSDFDEVFKENGVLKAEFYTHIPQDNIKNLF